MIYRSSGAYLLQTQTYYKHFASPQLYPQRRANRTWHPAKSIRTVIASVEQQSAAISLQAFNKQADSLKLIYQNVLKFEIASSCLLAMTTPQHHREHSATERGNLIKNRSSTSLG
jgi:hypothetical protein